MLRCAALRLSPSRAGSAFCKAKQTGINSFSGVLGVGTSIDSWVR